MHPRFMTFGRAIRSSRQCIQLGKAGQRPRIAHYICQSCRHKFSTTSIFRKVIQISKRTIATASKNGKEQKYPSNLLIYDAGDTRTAFVSFWKAMAILQFGSCLVFLVPVLYQNENQPNESIRTFQAIGVGLASAIPSAVLSFLTAPYVRQIYLQIPPSASHSLIALRAFARNIPSTTKLTFQTLRIFPFRKSTSAYFFELRALPPQKMRFANIEIPKNEGWRKRQREKGIWDRVFEFVNEPRFKFYVKEGRAYTMRSGVPGVWEEIARKIQEQTVKEVGKGGKGGVVVKNVRPSRSAKLIEEIKPKVVKRQTARPATKG